MFLQFVTWFFFVIRREIYNIAILSKNAGIIHVTINKGQSNVFEIVQISQKRLQSVKGFPR